MKKLLLLLFLPLFAFAQQSKTDSLQKVLLTLNSPLSKGAGGLSDTNKVNTLNALAMGIDVWQPRHFHSLAIFFS